MMFIKLLPHSAMREQSTIYYLCRHNTNKVNDQEGGITKKKENKFLDRSVHAIWSNFLFCKCDYYAKDI